jgi:hypothetical protein
MKAHAPQRASGAQSPRTAPTPESPQLAGNAAAAGQLGPSQPSPTPMLDAASAETALGGTGDTGAEPLQEGAGGITLTSETAWSAPDGSASSRTTVAAGEMVYFTASETGGTWTSSGGSGTDAGGIYNWTAGGPGTVTITYTKGRATATKTIRVVAPTGFSVSSTSAQSFGSGTQGVGMDVNLTVLPTAVSWGGIEVMEEVGSVSGTGYFENRTIPHDPEPWAGVSEANETGPDDASFSDWPSPWRDGTMTWTIPTQWRRLGAGTGARFTTSTQAMRIHDRTGRSTVSKFGTTSPERTP